MPVTDAVVENWPLLMLVDCVTARCRSYRGLGPPLHLVLPTLASSVSWVSGSGILAVFLKVMMHSTCSPEKTVGSFHCTNARMVDDVEAEAIARDDARRNKCSAMQCEPKQNQSNETTLVLVCGKSVFTCQSLHINNHHSHTESANLFIAPGLYLARLSSVKRRHCALMNGKKMVMKT